MGRPAPIRILIVDDHPIVRIGLRNVLEGVADFEIVGDAGDREGAVGLARTRKPDVALVDVNLPDASGFEIAAAIIAASPGTRVAMISGAFDERTLKGVAEAGARGFILKTETSEQFAAFVREIHQGGFCCSKGIPPPATARAADRLATPSGDSRLGALNPREHAMLIELAKGASLKEAAKALGIKYKIADHLKQAVMRKLNLHDRVEIVRFAIREGLIS